MLDRFSQNLDREVSKYYQFTIRKSSWDLAWRLLVKEIRV